MGIILRGERVGKLSVTPADPGWKSWVEMRMDANGPHHFAMRQHGVMCLDVWRGCEDDRFRSAGETRNPRKLASHG